MKPITNLAASVRQRLLNKAREGNRSFQEIAQSYLMERFLYRLSRSSQKENFVLKGALMLRVWQAPEARATMDIDLLGRVSNEEAATAAAIRKVLASEVEPDGLEFSAVDMVIERITEGAEYRGLRVQIPALLDTMRLHLQIDIGFGDPIYPPPQKENFPTILDLPAPVISCYSRESAIAEKLHAMLTHGQLNSRMKDFHDIWWLSRRFDFDGAVLLEAIDRTLSKRGISVPDPIVAFSDQFADTHQVQWSAFIKRMSPSDVPASFALIVRAVALFLGPLVEAHKKGTSFTDRWIAPGPWK
ncbi:MAG TPA: nucleotidyl transferase AbiEii/AbiGii toxin family protein [bacterium]|nr:nucleotidyl transferase AbiEii/AbiGii toxin family protein [bacterium]